MIAINELKQCLPNCSHPEQWVDPINKTIVKYDISNRLRLAAFIAQTGYESASYNTLSENLNYTADQLVNVFPRYFNQQTASAFAHQPEKIANHIYASRMGNGDEASGDGWKFRGRGLIQTTGKSNYVKAGAALNLQLTAQPDLLIQPENAALSAGLFWHENNLNELADKSDFVTITKRINGGTSGLSQRQVIYTRCLTVLK